MSLQATNFSEVFFKAQNLVCLVLEKILVKKILLTCCFEVFQKRFYFVQKKAFSLLRTVKGTSHVGLLSPTTQQKVLSTEEKVSKKTCERSFELPII